MTPQPPTPKLLTVSDVTGHLAMVAGRLVRAGADAHRTHAICKALRERLAELAEVEATVPEGLKRETPQPLNAKTPTARRRWPQQKKPITAARIERALDTLADLMARAGKDAPLAVPLWKRLQKELARLKEEEAIVAAARERHDRHR